MSKPLFLAPCIVLLAAAMAWPHAGYAKTAKACEAEWRANKATIQGAGKKKKDFIAECRAEPAQTAAPPAPAAAATPAPSTTETAKTEETPQRGRRTAGRPSLARPSGSGEFSTEAEAKSHCPGDTVVWANTRSKIYHFAGTRTYGKTRIGAYMCEKDTAAAGIRSAKNEKHP